MRAIRFLVPGTTGRFRCGGLLVELQTARLVAQIAPVEVVTYRQREPDHAFLDDQLRAEPLSESHAADAPLWIVSWGFDVPMLLRRLRGRATAYHAHSSGYGFAPPPAVPVLAVSRNTLGYWGDRAPRNPLFLVPNALEPQWLERGARPGTAAREAQQPGPRPIDVLIQQRKTSAYVLDQLVPALRQRGLRVEEQSGWVDDLVALFNSAAVYVYDSADYWRGRGVSEGFGLPPVEALACGCTVFSSLNHALADSLDPGALAHQIGCGTLAADVERIAAAVADPAAWQASPAALAALLEQLQEPVLLERWRRALAQIDRHWQRLLMERTQPLMALPPWRLCCRQLKAALRRRLRP
ncbi:MAG: glycosyltransferase [Synechococcus sp.]